MKSQFCDGLMAAITPVTSTVNPKICQDVELITGNMHTKFEKNTAKDVHFRGQVKVLGQTDPKQYNPDI